MQSWWKLSNGQLRTLMSCRLLPPKLPKQNIQLGWDLVKMEAIVPWCWEKGFDNAPVSLILPIQLSSGGWRWLWKTFPDHLRHTIYHLCSLYVPLLVSSLTMLEYCWISLAFHSNFVLKARCVGLLWATTVHFALNCTSHLSFLFMPNTVCLEVTGCREIAVGPWLAWSSASTKTCPTFILSMIRKIMTHYKDKPICQTSSILGFYK